MHSHYFVELVVICFAQRLYKVTKCGALVIFSLSNKVKSYQVVLTVIENVMKLFVYFSILFVCLSPLPISSLYSTFQVFKTMDLPVDIELDYVKDLHPIAALNFTQEKGAVTKILEAKRVDPVLEFFDVIAEEPLRKLRCKLCLPLEVNMLSLNRRDLDDALFHLRQKHLLQFHIVIRASRLQRDYQFFHQIFDLKTTVAKLGEDLHQFGIRHRKESREIEEFEEHAQKLINTINFQLQKLNNHLKETM